MREHAYGSVFDVSSPPVPTLTRRVVAENVGTAMLAAAVVGSGIAAERLSGGNTGLALLANSIGTGATLAALILALGDISGAHFNPVVSMARASSGDLTPAAAVSYIVAQCAGAFAGVVGANIMFGEPAIAWSSHARAGVPNALRR